MLKLVLPKEPYWLELSHGVRLMVRPLTTAVYESARRKSTRLVADLLRDHAEIELAGGSVEGLPDLNDTDAVEGVSQYLFAQALAMAGIVKWEGVGDEDGKPVDVSPETVARVMEVPRLAEEFLVEYTRPHEAMVSEGNASRPLPNGTMAGGRNTAKGAGKRASPAPKGPGSKGRGSAGRKTA
jgi:hypothetical protein